MPAYVAFVHKDKRSEFGISFPDVPGCVTAGRTLDEAHALAVEALSGHLAVMAEEGLEIPPPRTLDALRREAGKARAIAVLIVSVPDPDARPERVNITLPPGDLKAIDAYAKAHGLTRSGFLVKAARRAMRERAA